MKLKCTFSILIIFSGLNVFGQIFDRTINIDLSTDPSAYAVGDLTNNGYEEVVTAFENEDFISVVVNDSGFLNPPFVVDTKTESTINHLLLEDINNDKLNDIIFSDFENNRIGVLVNSGNLEFEPPLFFSTGKRPKKSNAYDFNGDAIKDLVVINEEGNSISLFYSDKEKLLLDPVEISTGATPNDIEIGDIDGDGFFDLVVVCKNDKMISIYYGDKNGFLTPIDITFEFNPINIEINDLDEDGNLDCVLIFDALNEIQILYGKGNRKFDETEKWISSEVFIDLDFVIDDFNDDNLLDIILATEYSGSYNLKMVFFEMKADKSFSHFVATDMGSSNNVNYLGFFDLKKQGEKNFLLGFPFFNQIKEHFPDNENNFPSFRAINVWGDLNRVDIGDMNNDGIFDIVVVNTKRDFISIYEGNNTGGYSFTKNFPGVKNAGELNILDLNNDENLDVLVNGANPGYFINNGNWEFEFKNLNNGIYKKGISTEKVDFNNDGFYDILGFDGIYLNTTNNSFKLVYKFENNIYGAKALNFNQDSIVDIVYYYADKITVVSGKKDGTYTIEKVIKINNLTEINTGDLNHDGLDDLIVTLIDLKDYQIKEGAILFATNKEDIFSDELLYFSIPESLESLAFDVDRDNKLELVFPTYRVEYYNVEKDSNINPLRFVTEDIFEVSSIFPFDYNRDGLMDLVTTSSSYDNHINIITNKLKGQITFFDLERDYSGKPIDSIVSVNPAHLNYTVLYNDSDRLPLEVGTYRVSVNIDDKTYKGSSDTTLTISKVPLLIKADTLKKIYGEENPELTLSLDFLLGYDTKYHIDELPTISTSAYDTSRVGLYPITLTGGNDRNYNITLQNGILEVKPAPLKVIASDIEINEGNQIPELNYTYEGFVNGDTESDLDKKPSIKIQDESVPLGPGEYTIKVGGAKGENYTITFQNGLLVINALTGIEDEEGNSLVQVFPNPGLPNQPIAIKAPQNAVFEIYNVQGNKLFQRKMESEIDKIQLKPGLYFLKFLDLPYVQKILAE